LEGTGSRHESGNFKKKKNAGRFPGVITTM